MAWYNQNLTDNSYAQFKLHDAESTYRPASVSDCYREEWKHQGARVDRAPDQDRVRRLEDRLAAAWNFYKFLKDSLARKGVFLSADKSHLKGFGSGVIGYGSCIYLQLKHGGKSYDILNLSVVGNDVNVEIRHPKAELFSDTLHSERVEIYLAQQKSFNPPRLSWISGRPMLSMRKFLGIDESALNKNLVIPPASILATEIALYIKSIIEYLDAGEQLRTFGESLAETVLYRDLAAIYANCANGDHWLLHGQRPISNGRSWLELDLQIFLKNDIKIAIEIQGPYHYPAMEQTNWEYIHCKHNTKINWCEENGLIFVWLDWETFNRCVVHLGQKQRPDAERRAIVRTMMNEIIEAHKNGHRFINIQMIDRNLTYGLNVPDQTGDVKHQNAHRTLRKE